MLAVYLIRHANNPILVEAQEALKSGGMGELVHRAVNIVARNENVGRLGGGPGMALKMWMLETWFYLVILAVIYGAVVGYASMWALKSSLRR